MQKNKEENYFEEGNYKEKASLKQIFIGSRHELRKTRTLTTTAALMGLSLALTFFVIQPTPFMKIGFSSLPIAIIGMFFGPTVAGLAAGMVDIFGYLIKPNGQMYFFGFTFDKIVMGIIFGLCFYKQKPNWKNVIVARILVTSIVNLFLNTTWLCLLFGQAMTVIFPARLIKNLALLPIDILTLYILTTFMYKIKKQAGY